MRGMILALAGGVGGARLARGLARILDPEDLLVVVNTGDDFRHLGLRISPDLDTVTYTLAGRADPQTGWGLAGDSGRVMAALEALGGETWFRLGDADLATHLERTRRLDAGESLGAATAALARRLGVAHRIAPMSDDPVRTMVDTAEHGRLAFQDYFVRHAARPRVTALDFAGAAQAALNPDFAAALADPTLKAVVVCPSNPPLSIGPILSLPGARAGLRECAAPVVAVSPLIAGKAVKGPTAAVMRSLGHEPTAQGVARFYGDLLDGFVIDRADAGLRLPGAAVAATDTLMRDADDSARLAETALRLADRIAGP